ncbi:unnamed protein product [Owenia fusiformis]|uniref:Uncharacterized protein n=1 Tax=Owenia fusiformis TaxID=6347 RepID=A0A8J1U917_OWEFU|nr:unnamed protein product [Owenia fusiformis]
MFNLIGRRSCGFSKAVKQIYCSQHRYSSKQLSSSKFLHLSALGEESSLCVNCTAHRYLSTSARQCADKSGQPGDPMQGKGPISWKSLLVALGLGGSLLFYVQMVKKEKEKEKDKERKRAVGKAKIGGEWELVDHNNKLRSSKDFHGQWCLLYFGFTHCPDICPEELDKMVQVVDEIDAIKQIPNVTPLFISVDPERDTVPAVAEYVKEFSDKIIGLTGSKDQVNTATRAYRVYYSEGPRDEDNDYIVDHTIIMYLVNPDGEFVDYYGQNKTATMITSGIAMQMQKFKNRSS